jgi:hypothetical protein
VRLKLLNNLPCCLCFMSELAKLESETRLRVLVFVPIFSKVQKTRVFGQAADKRDENGADSRLHFSKRESGNESPDYSRFQRTRPHGKRKSEKSIFATALINSKHFYF